jgi:hypothetical protein
MPRFIYDISYLIKVVVYGLRLPSRFALVVAAGSSWSLPCPESMEAWVKKARYVADAYRSMAFVLDGVIAQGDRKLLFAPIDRW